MRVGIVAQRGNESAVSLADDVAAALGDRSVGVVLDEATAAALGRSAPGPDFDACDLVVSIGGDGTFLYAADRAGTTPVLGVNLGEVGFLNAVAPGEAVSAVEAEVERFREAGALAVLELPRIAASGEGWTTSPALNEVTVQGPQRGHADGITVDVAVDGTRYTRGSADGVLVATPTGSTAYNLSEGGPLVHPGTSALVVNGMADAARARPLVVGLDSEVTIRVRDAERAVVTADGNVHRQLDLPATVTVERVAEPARVAGPGVDFFAALEKLD